MSGTAAPVGITTSGSTQIDAVSMSNGTTTVERQVLSIGDPTTWGNQLAVDSNGRASTNLNLNQQAQAPGFDIVATNATSVASVDTNGNLITRGPTLTDEGTFRAMFAGTSLLYSLGSVTVSGSTVTGTFTDAQDVRVGDYFKFDADAETAYVQITDVSPTTLTLASNYSGASSGAASRSKFKTKALTGTTQSVTSGQFVIASGTGGTTGQTSISRKVDYLPMSFKASYAIGQRAVNQVGWLGVRDDAATFTNHRFYAAFIFSGTTAGSVSVISGYNPAGAPGTGEKDQFTVTLPGGLSETSANEYRIDILSDGVYFYVNDTFVAKCTKHIPPPYATLTAGFWLDIQGATSASNHTLDYITVKNHNVVETNIFGRESLVATKFASPTTANGGVVSSTSFTYTYAIPAGTTMITVGVNGAFAGTLFFQFSLDSFTNAIPAAFQWNDGNNRINLSAVTADVIPQNGNAGSYSFGQSAGGSGFSYGEFPVPEGATSFKITCTAYTSGTPTVYVTPSTSTYKLQKGIEVEGIISNASTLGKLRPIIVGGSDGTLARNIKTDTNGNLIAVGAAASGSAVTGNPVLAAGSDGTNARTLLTSTSGVLDVQLTGATGTAMLPAAAADADALANPTTTQIAAMDSMFNGTTWDRARNNVNGTTGDTGAKTASFAGATQTNYNHHGAKITVLCGTVSGTTPTLNAQLQFSPDGGTTWLNYGPASGNVTATGNTITFDIFPTPFSSGSGTTSALTTGATQSVFITGVLPRTWRLNYTIGGTTPSFAITAVYVNYQM